MSTKCLVKAGMIAALYVVITFICSSFSFGPIQVRVAMGLELLSFFTPAGVIGCALGTLLSNILFGGLGFIDAVVGTLTTLLCGGLIFMLPNRHNKTWHVAWLVPIIPTSLAIGIVLHVTLNVPYLATVLTLAIGNSIAMFIGYCIFNLLRRNKSVIDRIKY